MEPRILAATLATLATIFAGLNGGAFTADDIRQTELADQQLTQQKGLNSLMPDIPLLDKLTQKPEPTNQVNAVIQIKDDSKLKLRQAEIKPKDTEEIRTKNSEINSDQDIQIQGYTGTLSLENQTRIQGSASAIETSGVNITQRLEFNTNITTERLEITGTNRSSLKLSQASIKPAPNSDFGINTDNTNLNINSYTGDITVYPGNKTLVINGKVDTLKAGKYQLQSQD